MTSKTKAAAPPLPMKQAEPEAEAPPEVTDVEAPPVDETPPEDVVAAAEDDFFEVAAQELARLEGVAEDEEPRSFGSRVMVLGASRREAHEWAQANGVSPRAVTYVSSATAVLGFRPTSVVFLPSFDTRRDRHAIRAALTPTLRRHNEIKVFSE